MQPIGLLVLFLPTLVHLQSSDPNEEFKEFRQKFLNLRNRANFFKEKPETTTAQPSTTVKIDLPVQSSTTERITLAEPILTTTTSPKRNSLVDRKPHLRYGYRFSDRKKHQNKRPGENKLKELSKFNKKEGLVKGSQDQELGHTEHRERLDLPVRGNNNPSQKVHSQLKGKEDDLEHFLPPPNIVELPAFSFPLFKDSFTPLKLEKSLESIILTPSETILSITNPLGIFAVANDLTGSIRNSSHLSQRSNTTNNSTEFSSRILPPLPKFEHSRFEFSEPFSFKHEPHLNPLRMGKSQTSSGTKTEKMFDSGKPTFHHIPTNKFDSNKLEKNRQNSPENLYENYFDSEWFPGAEKNETLLTSETRTRSKTEIKEVNGTLYEYEYIYYYDDEYPQYDYDTPVIGDYDTNKPSAHQRNSSVEPANPPSSLSPGTFIRPRPNSSTPRPRGHPNQITPERVVPKETFQMEIKTSQNEINDFELDSRHRNRQPIRSRGGEARSLGLPSENISQDINVEELKLPSHTRFPPRSTPPSRDIQRSQGNLNDPTSSKNERKEVSKVFDYFDPEPLTESIADYEFPDSTTQDSLSQNELAVTNLYALSRALDASEGDTATTAVNELGSDYNTQSPIDYDALYDYDDFGNATDFLLDDATTTIKTHPTTTQTTTAPPTTTADRGRGKIRGPRIRGSPLFRIRGSNKEGSEPEPKAEDSKPASENSSIQSDRFNRGKGRLPRPGIRGTIRPGNSAPAKEIEKDASDTISTEDGTTKSTTQRPTPPSRPSRPRPNLSRRFRPTSVVDSVTEPQKSHPDLSTSEPSITDKQTETSSPVVPTPTRQPGSVRGRPSSKNFLGRFNRGRRPVTEAPKSENIETASINSSQTSEKEILRADTEAGLKESQLTDDPQSRLPPSKKSPGRLHRFNFPDRFSKGRPSVDTHAEEKQIEEPLAATNNTSEEIRLQNLDEVITTTVSSVDTSAINSTDVVSIKELAKSRSPTHRFKNREDLRKSRNRVISLLESEMEAKNIKDLKNVTIDENEKKQDSISSIFSSTEASEAPSRFNRRRGHNRILTNERHPKGGHDNKLAALANNRKLQEKIGEEHPETDLAIDVPKEAAEEGEGTASKTVDDLISSAPEEEIPKKVSEPPVEGNDAQDPAPIGVVSAENPKEEASTTTEKLTRRQILAQRRQQFLGG